MFRPLRALAAIAIAGLLLTGCAQQPNTAVVINGERYTETEIADAWVDLQPIVGPGAGPSTVVATLIDRDLLAPAAEAFGISVSEEEINTVIEIEFGGQDPDEFSPVARGVIGHLLLVNEVNASPLVGEINSLFIVAAEEAEITVNPVYGEPGQYGSVEATTWDWLATPEADEDLLF